MSYYAPYCIEVRGIVRKTGMRYKVRMRNYWRRVRSRLAGLFSR